MDTAGYVALTRQSGLAKELQVVANNIANISTAGFRREGVVFAEMIEALPVEGGAVAMTAARVRQTDNTQGGLTQTGGTFDLAIEGDGFFMIETPQGNRLTRSGSFTPNQESELVTSDGYRVLDSGEAPIFVPPDAASIAVSPDGTMTADGLPLAQVGVFVPENELGLIREGGVLFRADDGVLVAENAQIAQGFLENSNVNPVVEIARMIEVQRSYELGQTFMDREDQRIRSVIRALGPKG